MEAQYAPPNNPLHLLDDFLCSLPPIEPLSNLGTDATESESQRSNSSPSHHEKRNDLTLRVAADLFANNLSLLENALSLLEEHEQFQSVTQAVNKDANEYNPIIRAIRAKRSGRNVILIQKQRKNKTRNFPEQDKRNKNEMNEFYLCLLGRDRANAWNRMQRWGMHCTCRSFFENTKGGRSSKGGTIGGMAPLSCQTVLCKHLLAVILMPHLLPWNEKGMKVEIIDDREFAKVISRASIG
ncbi:hypothetical protein HJC23_002193 [Cyclotella cryptica]|uniref:SWIM-type domain-containing protein n=1 Tax=Cyclotella cryptica TaxID=29204 RepID=A0ABD3Q7A4_9STRA